jgi:DNA polymerase-3 subunit gamma/tau
MIARAAEGSMRVTALSLLDQAIAHGGGKRDGEAVRSCSALPTAPASSICSSTLVKGDVAAALAEFARNTRPAPTLRSVLTDLADFTHLVTRMKFVPDAAGDQSLSEEIERVRGVDLPIRLRSTVLSRTWQMLLKGIPEVQTANRPINAAEMVLIRIAHAATLPTLDEALKAIESGAATEPAGVPRGNGGAPASPSSGPAASAVGQQYMPASSNGGGQAMRLVSSQPAAESAPVFEAPQAAMPNSRTRATIRRWPRSCHAFPAPR